MFDNDFFDEWLNDEAIRVQNQIKSGTGLSSDDKIVLILKAQTNHFHHLDIEFRDEMRSQRTEFQAGLQILREDMDKRFERVDKKLEQVDKHLEQVDKNLELVDKRLEQMDKQFELIDKRFEQVDKRFDQIDKRFEGLITRIDHFMVWSFATTLTVGGLVIAAIKLL